MEEDGIELGNFVSKEKHTQLSLDAEVQGKLDRRRALSDDGIVFAEGLERQGDAKVSLSAEVQAQLERRRCMSDDGIDLTHDIERRATSKRENLKTVGMSSDLQAIMARRREAAD